MNLDPKASQQSPDFPDSFFRIVTKGLVVRDGKVLVCHDFENPIYKHGGEGMFELPGGGLDFGESFHEGLRREIKEEMRLEVTHIADRPTYMWTVRRDGIRGMEWHWVLILAYEIEVASLDFTPSDSCRAIEFMSKEDLHKNKARFTDQLQPFLILFNPADFQK